MSHKLSCAKDGFRPLLTLGQFFPGNRNDLESLLTQTVENINKNHCVSSESFSLPRGAFQFSGIDILTSLSAVVPRFQEISNIILIARVLRETEHCIWLPDYSGFDTPFRRHVVDAGVILNLEKLSSVFIRDRINFEEDPAFDLPLVISGYLGYFGSVLPVLLGSSSDELIATLKNTLPRVFEKSRTLIFTIALPVSNLPPGNRFL